MASHIPKFFEYMKVIGQLKKVDRTGWVLRGVKDPESVAEHMYRMAMISFAIPSSSGLDKEKCMKIALVHDMAESVVGDLTPWCGISKEEKSRREKEATQHISSLLPSESKNEMYELWLEYENQSSPEARFVKDVDKFEMLFQAFEYENDASAPGSLQEFYDYAKKKHKFSCDFVSSWCEELITVRQKCLEADSSLKSTEADDGSKRSLEADDGSKRSLEAVDGIKRSLDGGVKRSLEADDCINKSFGADDKVKNAEVNFKTENDSTATTTSNSTADEKEVFLPRTKIGKRAKINF